MRAARTRALDEVTVTEPVERFLCDRDLAAGSRTRYRSTLDAIVANRHVAGGLDGIDSDAASHGIQGALAGGGAGDVESPRRYSAMVLELLATAGPDTG